jgi:hypothetical protein
MELVSGISRIAHLGRQSSSLALRPWLYHLISRRPGVRQTRSRLELEISEANVNAFGASWGAIGAF